MTYYFIVFICLCTLRFLIPYIKKSFYSLALSTITLLNVIIDSSLIESVKFKTTINKLTHQLLNFGNFLMVISISFVIVVSPMLLFIGFYSLNINSLDFNSPYFFLSMIIGSIFIFMPLRKKKNNYSDWSRLFHRMILDNYNISKSLLNLDKTIFKKKLTTKYKNFVIVSGLARSGTTALINLLFQTNKFHSLTYANMPFLLAVNCWRKVYRPKRKEFKERAHGDNVNIGFNSIEALEEYFFKVFLNDNYIKEQFLEEHKIDYQTYKSYIEYQKLINTNRLESTYLAKNNNLILRYNSLRNFNPGFKIIFMFRDPVSHAMSLLNQHKLFSELQRKDSFILDYMNWLGHHEFGLNHKYFKFDNNDVSFKNKPDSINYWLIIWINYYSKILKLLDDNNLVLVDYTDLLKVPYRLVTSLGTFLNIDLKLNNIKQFAKPNSLKLTVDKELENKSIFIYNELLKNKMKLLN